MNKHITDFVILRSIVSLTDHRLAKELFIRFVYAFSLIAPDCFLSFYIYFYLGECLFVSIRKCYDRQNVIQIHSFNGTISLPNP